MLLRISTGCVFGLLMAFMMHTPGQSLEYVEWCSGWDCDVEGQICPKGAEGAGETGYSCRDGKWTPLAESCLGYECGNEGQICPKGTKGAGDDNWTCTEGKWTKLSDGGNGVEEWGDECEDKETRGKWINGVGVRCIELGGRRLEATTQCLWGSVISEDNGGEGWNHSTANSNCFSKAVLFLMNSGHTTSSVLDLEDVEVDPDTFIALRSCMKEYEKGYGPGTWRNDGGAGYWWLHLDGCCKETGVEDTGGCEAAESWLESLCRDPGQFEWCDDGRCEGHKRCIPYELW